MRFDRKVVYERKKRVKSLPRDEEATLPVVPHSGGAVSFILRNKTNCVAQMLLIAAALFPKLSRDFEFKEGGETSSSFKVPSPTLVQIEQNRDQCGLQQASFSFANTQEQRSDTTLESIRIGRHTVHFTPPLPAEYRAVAAKNFKLAKKQVRVHEELRTHLRQEMRFCSPDGVHFAFRIESDNGSTHYLAGPKFVARVGLQKKDTQAGRGDAAAESLDPFCVLGERTIADLRSKQEVSFKKGWETPNSTFLEYNKDGLVVVEEYRAATIHRYTERQQDGSWHKRIEYYPNGREKSYEETESRRAYAFKGMGTITNPIRIRYCRPDGSRMSEFDREKGFHAHYEAGGAVIHIAHFEKDEKSPYENWICLSGGRRVGLYHVEREIDPSLTPRAYIERLASLLDTPDRLHAYFALALSYTGDKTEDGFVGEHWQRAERTLERCRGTVMLGDCDDYAFLARDILRAQGKSAHVLFIPGHALCAWGYREGGRYHAATIGTFGLDVNGNRFGEVEDPEKVCGYATMHEALQSVMEKYARGGIGLSTGTQVKVEKDQVKVLDIIGEDYRYYGVDSIEILWGKIPKTPRIEI